MEVTGREVGAVGWVVRNWQSCHSDRLGAPLAVCGPVTQCFPSLWTVYEECGWQAVCGGCRRGAGCYLLAAYT